MRRCEFIALVGGGVAASTLAARAARPTRIRRVGVLHVVPVQASLTFLAFRKKLGELGYVEGENIVFEYRWSDQTQRLPSYAAELTDLKMDVIVTVDLTTTLVAKQATKDIPIVAAIFMLCAAWRINQIWPVCGGQLSSSSSVRRQDSERCETG